jgi:HEAT repeat protein
MCRPAFLVLLFLTLAGWSADCAWAHGGNFKETGPQGPGVDIPDTPPPSRPVTTENATWLSGDWQTWWDLHRDGFLPDKRTVRRRAARTASGGLFGVGRVQSSGLTHWERALEKGALDTALPYLLEVLDPASVQDDRMIAAALVALGRIARDATSVAILKRYAARADVRVEVRESAVLGLGLLRRTERSAQLDAETLTGIRTFLFALFDEKDAPTRVRAFALYAIALLSDQPYGDTLFERDGRHVTQALWERLRRRYPAAELPVALLTALGMQPRAGVPTGVLQGLEAISKGKPFRGRRWDALRRSHALAAYARLDGPGWLPMVLWVLRGTREHVSVRAAAAIALTRRAGDLDPDERYQAGRSLLSSLPREPHWFAAGLEQIALGSMLREDLLAGQTRFVEKHRVDRYLRREALQGRTMTRPYAALALGVACYGLEPVNRTCAEVLKEVRGALTHGLRHGRGSDQVLGAYAVALGLAQAEGAHSALLAVLQDRKRGAGLRGHCAVTLGHLGRDTPQLREALHKAAEERVSPLVHQGAVRALALLAAPETAERLLRQLETTRSRFAVGVVAGALGRFGDPQAAGTLVRIARDKVEALRVRLMSVVALGLIFDPEPRPSRVRMTTHANYPSRTSALTQVFNIM